MVPYTDAEMTATHSSTVAANNRRSFLRKLIASPPRAGDHRGADRPVADPPSADRPVVDPPSADRPMKDSPTKDHPTKPRLRSIAPVDPAPSRARARSLHSP